MLVALLLASLALAPAARGERPTLPTVLHSCYDIPDPLTKTFVPVDCLHAAIAKRALDPSGTAPAVSTPVSTGAPTLPSATAQLPQAFAFDYNCVAPADRPDYCPKAQAAFEIAGQILTDILEIKRTIHVNVSLYTFCDQGVCLGSDRPTNLGAAGPTRFIPLRDDDGVSRLYPQALVKQFQLTNEPDYTEYDINAKFNANETSPNVPTYYPNDPLPTGNVSDFTGTVLHELIHGLGFLSSWTYIPDGPLYLPNVDAGLFPNGSRVFTGFSETVFDRFVFRVDTQPPVSLSSVTSYLNELLFPTPDTTYSDPDDFLLERQSLVQTASLGAIVTTPRTLAFGSVAGLARFLETSLNPWRDGSSGSHLDFRSYFQAPDWLMVWADVGGGNMQQIIATTNGLVSAANATLLQDQSFLDSVDLRLAVGPGIRAMLGSLGWDLRLSSDPGSNAAPADVTARLTFGAEGDDGSGGTVSGLTQLPTGSGRPGPAPAGQTKSAASVLTFGDGLVLAAVCFGAMVTL